MSLINPLEEWAADADLTQSYDSQKVADGWAVGEPPHNKKWNQRENARDRMINATKAHTEALGTASPIVTREVLCGQRTIGNEWADPCNGINNYDTGDTIRDACICMASSDPNPYIAYLQTDGTVTIITIDSINPCWNFEGSWGKVDIALTYPSTPDQVEAIACDGTYLFVAWSLDSGHHFVTAFSLLNLTGSAAWTCDTTIDKGSGGIDEVTKMIVADSTRIALQVQTGIGGTGTERTTAIITKATGALEGTGTGSHSAGYGDDSSSRCRPVSDGLSIYWIGYQTVDATRHYYLMSCKLSDPTTSYFASASIGILNTAETWTHPKALCYTRGGILVMTPGGAVEMYDMTDGTVFHVAQISSDPDPALYEGNQDAFAVHDGLNVWLSAVITDGVDVEHHALFKMPTGIFRPDAYRAAGTYRPVICNPVILGDAAIEESATNTGGRLLFDGRDLWTITRDGQFYRTVSPGLR